MGQLRSWELLLTGNNKSWNLRGWEGSLFGVSREREKGKGKGKGKGLSLL